jgi:hypothetical protein
MEFLNSVASLASLIAFIAFIWLLVVAFKKGVLWGILVFLLSPISASIFAAKYWSVARKPFLVYIVTVTISFAYFAYAYQQLGISEVFDMQAKMESGEFTEDDTFAFMEGTMDRMENSGMLDAQEQQDLEQMKQIYNMITQDMQHPQGSANLPAQPALADSADAQKPAPQAAKTAQTKPYERPALSYQDVSFGELAQFVNRPLIVFDRQGREHQVTLLTISSDGLQLRRSIAGGNFDFGMRKVDIERIQALVPTIASS